MTAKRVIPPPLPTDMRIKELDERPIPSGYDNLSPTHKAMMRRMLSYWLNFVTSQPEFEKVREQIGDLKPKPSIQI